MINPKFVDSCRRLERKNDNGKLLYKGSWMNLKTISNGVLWAVINNGLMKTIQCFQALTEVPDDLKGNDFSPDVF